MERILVVEDDRAVHRALRRLFEPEGYSVDAAFDGQSFPDGVAFGGGTRPALAGDARPRRLP